jgi:hypothetical protein
MFFGIAFGGLEIEATPPPFFKAPKVHKTMVENRAIPVSVKI